MQPSDFCKPTDRFCSPLNRNTKLYKNRTHGNKSILKVNPLINNGKRIYFFFTLLDLLGVLIANLNSSSAVMLEAPIKLTTSGRGKLTTYFAGEDLFVQVC